MGVITMRSVVLPLAILALLAVAAFAADAKAEAKTEEKVDPVDDSAEDDPAKQGKEELDKMDGNKDGKADLAEITAYMKKEFYGPEDIKEDKLTPAQVDEKAGTDAKEYLDELDKNKDTFLDLSEFTAHYKEDVDDVDSELDEAGDEDDDSGSDDAADEDAGEDE